MDASSSTSSSTLNDFPPSPDSPMNSVPLVIWKDVFLKLPSEEVVRHCRLVCKSWKEVADSALLWFELCKREGYTPRNASMTPNLWRDFFFLCKNRRNLLKNTKAEENFTHWESETVEDDDWTTANSRAPHPNNTVQKNFVTLYHNRKCLKSQLIDLKAEGYNLAFIDEYQPPIKISDWYAAPQACVCEYTLRVDLLDQNQTRIKTFESGTIPIEQQNDQLWLQMTHIFQNYGPGVRYIYFTHGGRSLWSGGEWTGLCVTDSSVEICPEAE